MAPAAIGETPILPVITEGGTVEMPVLIEGREASGQVQAGGLR